jgi:hypothetical protein
MSARVGLGAGAVRSNLGRKNKRRKQDEDVFHQKNKKWREERERKTITMILTFKKPYGVRDVSKGRIGGGSS